MIKAFTISFEFEGKTYLALASFRKEYGSDLSYSVHFFDDALTRILPQDCTEHIINQSLSQEKQVHPLANRLHSCIRESIKAHLNCIRA